MNPPRFLRVHFRSKACVYLSVGIAICINERQVRTCIDMNLKLSRKFCFKLDDAVVRFDRSFAFTLRLEQQL
jgi:hypothetical protein